MVPTISRVNCARKTRSTFQVGIQKPFDVVPLDSTPASTVQVAVVSIQVLHGRHRLQVRIGEGLYLSLGGLAIATVVTLLDTPRRIVTKVLRKHGVSAPANNNDRLSTRFQGLEKTFGWHFIGLIGL